ncbi:GIY-YIG nuclease family protein [Chryseobacterium sp. 3008163]|uniref:GIY-YIG nuclease family protein n=1 Tax=Chryseobacterium sp. 3008163 TaxID=2478663 RepID=UPI000F0CE346|nr:hypothetical protein [Chryseobacterium sp. 3008163]AYM99896.1 hypothetical protein EAG08_05690 [Chryseobacterium sp. 3008163]
MNKSQVEEYLLKLENLLLFEAEKYNVELNRNWSKSFPNESAVYIFREDDEICYIGETGSLRGRMTDILNTKNHTLRRNLGNFYFSSHSEYEKPSSRKSFSESIEKLLNEKLINNLTISYILVNLGRKELEERLFYKIDPKYSLKGKRGQKVKLIIN